MRAARPSSGCGCTGAGRRSRAPPEAARERPGARSLVRAPELARRRRAVAAGACATCARNFPAARLEVLARPWVAELYGAVAEVDARAARARGARADAARAPRRVRRRACCCPNSFGSALAAWLAGIPERWGYATDGRGPLLTRARRVPAAVRGRSQVYYYRAMLAGVGLARLGRHPTRRSRCPPAWAERAATRCSARRAVDRPQPRRRSTARAKRWLPERFAAVGDALARRSGARVAIVGGAARAAAGRGHRRAACARRRACSAARRRLAELVGVLVAPAPAGHQRLGPDARGRRARRAGGGGVRPHRLARDGARWATRHRIVREPVHCSPCRLRECPIDHRCMTRVGVDRVVAEARACSLAGDAEQPRRPAIFIDRDGTLSARGRLRQPPLALPPVPLRRGRRPPGEPQPVPGRAGHEPGRRGARLLPGVADPRGARRAATRRMDAGGARLDGDLLLPAPSVGRASRRTARTATAASRGRACCTAPPRSSASTSRARA